MHDGVAKWWAQKYETMEYKRIFVQMRAQSAKFLLTGETFAVKLMLNVERTHTHTFLFAWIIVIYNRCQSMVIKCAIFDSILPFADASRKPPHSLLWDWIEKSFVCTSHYSHWQTLRGRKCIHPFVFFFFVVLVRTSPTPVNNTAHEHITYSHSRIDTLRITTLTNVQRAPCLECFIDIHICVFVHSWVKCRKFVSHSEFSLLYTNFSTSGNCEVEKKIKQPQQQQFTAERIKWAPTAAGSRWRSTTSAPFAVFVLG